MEKFKIKDLVGRTLEMKKTFFVLLAVSMSIWLFLAITLPNQFKSSIKVVPEESQSSFNLAGVSSFAKLADFSLPQTTGASSFDIYLLPEIGPSVGFLYELLDDSLLYKGKEITVSDYFLQYYEPSYVEHAVGFISEIVSLMRPSSGEVGSTNTKSELIWVSEEEAYVIGQLMDRLEVAVDLENSLITVSAVMPSRVLSVSLTDIYYNRILRFIDQFSTERINDKIRFLKGLQHEKDSIATLQETILASFLSSNNAVSSQFLAFKQRSLELKYNNALSIKKEIDSQLELAKIDQKEKKTIFKVVKPIVFPLKKHSPSRLLLGIGFLFGATFIYLSIVIVKYIWVENYEDLVL